MGALRAPLDYVNRGALRACLYKAARYARTSVLSQVSVALRARAPTHTVRSHSLTHKQATSRATYLRTVLSTIHLLPEATLRNSIYYTTRAALGAKVPTLADLPCRQHALPPDTYASSVGLLQGVRVAPTSCPRRARSAPHMAILRVAHYPARSARALRAG